MSQLTVLEMVDRTHAGNVNWLRGRPDTFAADPFSVTVDGYSHVFFEEYDYRTDKGSIAHASLDSSGEFGPTTVVVDRPYHLSYPYLVERQGEIFMVPESSAVGELIMLAATEFPHSWRECATLLKGIPAVDSSVVYHEGMWWMFLTIKHARPNEELHLFHALDLFGPWTPHVENPVKTDIQSARSAGPLFVADSTLYRPAQDCADGYGTRVVVNRIVELTPAAFVEAQVGTIAADQKGDYPLGLHTVASAGAGTLVDGKRSAALRDVLVLRARSLVSRAHPARHPKPPLQGS